MDERQYLQKQILKCRRKMNWARLLKKSSFFMTLGGVAAILLEAVSLVFPFYYVHMWAVGSVAAGFAVGIVCAVIMRTGMKEAAQKLDGFGLKERVLTAYENLQQDNELVRLQRKDAVCSLAEAKECIRIPVLPEKRYLAALFLSLLCACALAFVPSQSRDLAKEQHAVQQQARKKEEELKKMIQALEKIDTSSMTEEQKAQLQELLDSMELSMEEFKKVDSRENFAAAEQKLEYKYQQTAQGLENLASQMDNPAGAGIASAEEMAKAAAAEGQEIASNANASTGNETGDKSESGAGDSNGSNGEDGDGSGNGNGNGDGSGDGNGDGDGNGNGNGNGSGSGRGTGAGSDTHDYVSVPNEKGKDSGMTGKKDSSENSDYYRAQNGLSWEGEHVSLESVIGDYTQDAYDGISSGKYPNGMENIIKDYFKNLNE